MSAPRACLNACENFLYVLSAECDRTGRQQRCRIYYNQVDKGGHFAAWEQPDPFTIELRAAFRSLR